LYLAISVSTRQHKRGHRERSERGRDRTRETKDGEREKRHNGRKKKRDREEEEDTYREPKRRTVYTGKKVKGGKKRLQERGVQLMHNASRQNLGNKGFSN